MSTLAPFHPVVRAWFEERFPQGPTPPQAAAWPLIPTGDDILVASPTGSGKTLTAFLVAIDAMWKDPPSDKVGGPRVLYLSPLRALATDVRANLLVPLEELRERGGAMGFPTPEIRVDLRTGDTTESERAAQRRNPAHIYVTTPESLYLLLTSASGRSMLRHVETVIVDEIHAMCRDKRGSHLTISLERLDRLVTGAGGPRPQRIGLSATQKPLSLVAAMLSGVGPDRTTRILDCSARRAIDVAIELPHSELDSVFSGEQFAEQLGTLATLVLAHRTTLIFVSNRRMAERMAHRLAEALSEGDQLVDAELVVASHHGSLSTHRRRDVERRLRAGDLRALVATSSLELGIDVGPVELVCQIGSPRSIATFLQRVGRANHQVGGTPKGRLFPMNRHELVESIALLDSLARGELDAIEPPVAPLDILAQQMVAEVAARGEDRVDDLFSMVTAAAPYQDLSRELFDEVLEMSSRGILTGHGPRGAHLHHDPLSGTVRSRRGASLAAYGGAGAIPDTGEYRVVLDPEGLTVGSVDEDFAIEAMAGDVFLLGTHPWRVTRVETSVVRVIDAEGASPTIPFWFGESPGRTIELSGSVARIHETVLDPLARRDGAAATELLASIPGVPREAAAQAVAFLSSSYETLGTLPTPNTLVLERFFDETESCHLVLHSPHGARVNRALGLALRKRFCVTFDFELQAAADDDTVTIALGPHHSFELASVGSMVRSRTVRDVLTQAVLPLPMLAARWRWNTARALVMRRSMNGQRRPIHLQRMEADDLMAATWPSLAACQENAPAGPIPIPDHVLVRQTIDDVLFEPLDIIHLEQMLGRLEAGELRLHCVDVAEPSLLAHGIIHGRPYTFLDDAPLEERRTRAIATSRGSGDRAADGLPAANEKNALDADLVAEVVSHSAPRVRNADELADLMVDAGAVRATPGWQAHFDELLHAGRASEEDHVWLPVAGGRSLADITDDDELAASLLRAHLAAAGPVTLDTLTADAPLGPGHLRGAPLTRARAATAMARLEAAGYAMSVAGDRFVARHTYARLNRMARQRRRASYVAVPVAQYYDFLTRWQHVAPGSVLEGREGLRRTIDQLQGVEIAAAEWERSVLAQRVRDYRPEWLDELCLSGEVTWARLTPKASDDGRGAAAPSASTPLALMLREDQEWQLRAVRLDTAPVVPTGGAASDVYEALGHAGAQFRASLGPLVKRLPTEVDEGLWDLVARGIVTADAFSAVRSLLGARRLGRGAAGRRLAMGAHRAPASSGVGEGRWSLVHTNDEPLAPLEFEQIAERVAEQLVVRWGIVTYELFATESYRIPWRYVAWALRRLEARGEVVGGRFVAGLAGEQYAHLGALELLASPAGTETVTLAACDPLNLTGGIVSDLRVPARVHKKVSVLAGEVVDVG